MSIFDGAGGTLTDLVTNATSVVVIPGGDGRAFFEQRVKLDGREYFLTTKWNQREGRWYISLFDNVQEPIVESIKLVSNWPLLRYYKFDPRTPPGELFAMDRTGDGSPPGFDDVGSGKRVELTYIGTT